MGILQKTLRVRMVKRDSGIAWLVVPWLVHCPPCQIGQPWTRGKAAGSSALVSCPSLTFLSALPGDRGHLEV